MSMLSKVFEYILDRKLQEYLGDADNAHRHMMERSLVEDEPYKIPKRLYRTKVESKEMFGCQMLVFNDVESAQHVVIYLHGGAYVDEIMTFHISFCDKIAKMTNSVVFAPIYPLAPNHTYEETYRILEKFYEFSLEIAKPITIMGDSSGGGLSAAFCEHLGVIGLKQPEHLILISPWVDVSLSGDYNDVYPLSGVNGLRELGLAWAGDLDPKDYKVSPLFGDVEKLPNTTIFVGTHEATYNDIIGFYRRLKDNNVDVELNVGEEMNHVYPIYPLISEAKDALSKIVDVISD